MAVAAPKTKAVLYVAAAAVVLFVFALVHQRKEQSEQMAAAIAGATSKMWPFKPSGLGDNSPSFYEVALAHGTDKVTTHHYENMYERYLPALRHKRIKMLEIGLGCDMSYGPGASYHLWLEYFTNVDLYFMEYNADCAAMWADKTTGATVFTGDQGNPNDLERFLAENGRDFDIIVDDGGHTMVQQITSLQHLWKAVKPGGIYFCEDLATSFNTAWGGAQGAKLAGQDTMLSYIAKMMLDMHFIDDLNPRQANFEDVEKIVHIDCSEENCAFLKRKLE